MSGNLTITCGTCVRDCLPDGDCYGCEVDRLREELDALEPVMVLVRKIFGNYVHGMADDAPGKGDGNRIADFLAGYDSARKDSTPE